MFIKKNLIKSTLIKILFKKYIIIKYIGEILVAAFISSSALSKFKKVYIKSFSNCIAPARVCSKSSFGPIVIFSPKKKPK